MRIKIIADLIDYLRYVRAEIPNPEKDDPKMEGRYLPRDIHQDRWKGRLCEVYWGSHGCCRPVGHRGLCCCICCECPPGIFHQEECVAYAPYYGPETRFYGDDAVYRGLPLVEPYEHE